MGRPNQHPHACVQLSSSDSLLTKGRNFGKAVPGPQLGFFFFGRTSESLRVKAIGTLNPQSFHPTTQNPLNPLSEAKPEPQTGFSYEEDSGNPSSKTRIPSASGLLRGMPGV